MFSQPGWWWLLPILLALLALGLRQRRRRPRTVSAYVLFERAHARLAADPSKTRSKPPVILICICIAAVAGLAGLRWQSPVASGEHPPIFILDRSASMATRDAGGRTRAERVLQLAEERFGEPAERHSSPRGKALELRAALGASSLTWLAGDGPPRFAEAGRSIFLTDRLPEEGESGGWFALGVSDDGVGGAGITAAMIQEAVGEADEGAPSLALLFAVEGRLEGRRLFARVRSGDADWRTLELGDAASFAASDGPIRRRARLLAQDAQALSQSDRLELRLEPSDANPLDDIAVLVKASGPVVIGFPAEGGDALARAFAALPDVETIRGEAPESCALRVGTQEGMARSLAAGTQRSRWLTWPAASARFRSVEGELSGQGAFAEVALGRHRFEAHALPDAAPEPEAVLVRVGEEPLLIRTATGFHLCADPERGSWKGSPSFPLTIGVLMEELQRRGGRLAGSRWASYSASEPYWPVPGSLLPGASEPLGLGPHYPAQPGVFEVLEVGGRTRLMAFSLLDPAETRQVLGAGAGAAFVRSPGAGESESPAAAERPSATWDGMPFAYALAAGLCLLAAWRCGSERS